MKLPLLILLFCIGFEAKRAETCESSTTPPVECSHSLDSTPSETSPLKIHPSILSIPRGRPAPFTKSGGEETSKELKRQKRRVMPGDVHPEFLHNLAGHPKPIGASQKPFNFLFKKLALNSAPSTIGKRMNNRPLEEQEPGFPTLKNGVKDSKEHQKEILHQLNARNSNSVKKNTSEKENSFLHGPTLPPVQKNMAEETSDEQNVDDQYVAPVNSVQDSLQQNEDIFHQPELKPSDSISEKDKAWKKKIRTYRANSPPSSKAEVVIKDPYISESQNVAPIDTVQDYYEEHNTHLGQTTSSALDRTFTLGLVTVTGTVLFLVIVIISIIELWK